MNFGWLTLLAAWFALAPLSLRAAARFPPPEFESGYKPPLLQTPAPRALWLQYADAALLAGGLVLASHLIFTKRSRRGVAWLSLFSLGYFGFYRQGCVCSIGSIQNVALALCDRSYTLPATVLVFFAAPLAATLLAGRTFCAALCPHGALQDWALIKPLKIPDWLENGLGALPFIYLGAGVLLAAMGSAFLICQYDPIVPIFRRGGPFPMVSFGIGLLLLSTVVGRPYCRFLCPYGALLRVAAALSKWRVRITAGACIQCRLCQEACPFGAIRLPEDFKPSEAAASRNRLRRSVLLLPALALMSGWLGAQLSRPLSEWHPQIKVAEQLLAPAAMAPPKSKADALALDRSRLRQKDILIEALRLRRQFYWGGWILGAWIGLVFSAKWISASLPRQRPAFEPDRAACLACARCFSSCPNERPAAAFAPNAAAESLRPTAAGSRDA